MTWEEAEARVRTEAPSSEPAEPPVAVSHAPIPALVVVDHFDLSMVEPQPSGTRLLVQPLSRVDALRLVRESRGKVAVAALNERAQGMLERELQLEPAWRPKVSFGTRLLVVSQVRWNEVRWHLVTYESDGDGCVP